MACGHDKKELQYVALWYPDMDSEEDDVFLDLVHVRASDGLQIKYDFERDGWSIKQPRPTKKIDDITVEEEWIEVYFAQSYALDPEP